MLILLFVLLCHFSFAKENSNNIKLHVTKPEDQDKDRAACVLALVVTDAIMLSAYESSREWNGNGRWGKAPIRKVLVSDL